MAGRRRVSGQELNRRVRRYLAAGLNLWLDGVLAASQALVPLEEGTLAESGHVDKAEPHLLAGRVVYATPYAAAQHEGHAIQIRNGKPVEWVVRRHSQPGRQTKYLEQPFKAAIPTLAPFMEEIVQKGIRLS